MAVVRDRDEPRKPGMVTRINRKSLRRCNMEIDTKSDYINSAYRLYAITDLPIPLSAPISSPQDLDSKTLYYIVTK